MPSPLQWFIQLLDGASGPASKMAKEVDKFDKGVEKAGKDVDKHSKKIELSFKSMFREIEKANEHATEELVKGFARKFTLFEAVKGAGELAEKLIEVGAEFARDTLKAADFERTSGIIFATLTGSAEAGEEVISRVKHFAKETGVSISESMDLFRSEMVAGVKDVGDNFEILAQASTDIGHLTKQSAQSVIQSFADITSKGELTGRSLQAFVGAVPFDKLAKRLGVASGSWKELQERLTTSPVKAGKGIQAILDTLAEVQGGKLGRTSVDIGNGFEGMSTKIHNAWENLLGSFSKTDAFKEILDIMGRIAAAMDPQTESGKALEATFERLARTVENFLKPLLEPGGMDTATAKMVQFGDSVVTVVGALAKVATYSGHFIDMLTDTDAWKKYEPKAEEAGEDHGAAFVEGVRGPEGLDAHSPSRKMMEIGREASAGFDIGAGGGADAGGFVADRLPSGAAGRAGGHRLELHQQFTIHAGTGMDVDALARRVAELSVTSLEGPLENLAISVGTM